MPEEKAPEAGMKSGTGSTGLAATAWDVTGAVATGAGFGGVAAAVAEGVATGAGCAVAIGLGRLARLARDRQHRDGWRDGHDGAERIDSAERGANAGSAPAGAAEATTAAGGLAAGRVPCRGWPRLPIGLPFSKQAAQLAVVGEVVLDRARG